MPDAPVLPLVRRPAPGPNNRQQIETVSRNRQILANVRKDPEALALARKRNRDDAYFAAGLALADAYLTEYGDRDAATGSRTAARKTLTAANRAARAGYNDLRSTLRTEYDGQPDHLETLGVARPRAASDRDAFLDEARATLAAARRAPYAAALALVGYEAKALAALDADVDALETAASSETSAAGTHGGSTAGRDAAYAAFMAWMKPARRWLALAFKGRPDVASRVGL